MRASVNAVDHGPAQWRRAWYWAAGTAVAAGLLWAIGDPWLVEHFGTGAPWWAYALIGVRLAYGIARLWMQDLALRQAWQDESEPDARPRPAQEAGVSRSSGRPGLGHEG